MARRKAQSVALQRVFIMDPAYPLRRIVERDCMIVVGEKMTWAETPSGKRHLVGTSAFMTLPSAERAKRGALVKIVDQTVLSRMANTFNMWHSAKTQLERYDATGQFVPGKKPH